MVGMVLRRLLSNTEGLKGDWEFHVINDEEQMNAFVLPGWVSDTRLTAI